MSKALTSKRGPEETKPMWYEVSVARSWRLWSQSVLEVEPAVGADLW